MLPTKFRFIWPSGFRGEDFQKSTDQKQELPVATMFVHEQSQNAQSIQRTFHRCFLPSFGSFGKAVSQENIFQNSTNQKQELPVVAMFVNGPGRNEHSLLRTLHRLGISHDIFLCKKALFIRNIKKIHRQGFHTILFFGNRRTL